MRDALSANPDLDGVFCTNDDICDGCASAVPRAKPRRARTNFHCGFSWAGDWQANDPRKPRQRNYSRFDIGRMAAQMLLSKIKNNDHNHNTVDLPGIRFITATRFGLFSLHYTYSLCRTLPILRAGNWRISHERTPVNCARRTQNYFYCREWLTVTG